MKLLYGVSFHNITTAGVTLNKLNTEEAWTNTVQLHLNYYYLLSFCKLFFFCYIGVK
jgi:hypothetical protein